MNSSAGISDQVSQFISPRLEVFLMVGLGSSAGTTDMVLETTPPASALDSLEHQLARPDVGAGCGHHGILEGNTVNGYR